LLAGQRKGPAGFPLPGLFVRDVLALTSLAEADADGQDESGGDDASKQDVSRRGRMLRRFQSRHEK